MSKQSDAAFMEWQVRDTGTTAEVLLESESDNLGTGGTYCRYRRDAWNAALDWSRPIVAEAIRKAKAGKKRFYSPTVDEVRVYMDEQGFFKSYQTAGEFVAYYETRGWIPNGQRVQMKSWKAAVRTWKHNGALLKPSPKHETSEWKPDPKWPEATLVDGRKIVSDWSKECLAISKGGKWVQP